MKFISPIILKFNIFKNEKVPAFIINDFSRFL